VREAVTVWFTLAHVAFWRGVVVDACAASGSVASIVALMATVAEIFSAVDEREKKSMY
jgi:hypothetical protein